MNGRRMNGWWMGTLMTLLLLLGSAAWADIYWEVVQESKGMMHEPDSTDIIKNYMTAKAFRVEQKEGFTIMDFESKKMYQIDPASKTYQQIDMTALGQPPAEMKGEEAEAVQKMMKGMMSEIQVTPTQEKKQIAGYDCQKYLVSIMMMQSEYWLSKAVPGYAQMKEIGKKMKSLFESNPMMRQMNIAGMMDKLDGFPVQTVMHMMNGTITSTLKTIETKSLDPSLFKVPSGYTLSEDPGMHHPMPPSKRMKKP